MKEQPRYLNGMFIIQHIILEKFIWCPSKYHEMKILLPVTSAKIWPESGILTVNITNSLHNHGSCISFVILCGTVVFHKFHSLSTRFPQRFHKVSTTSTSFPQLPQLCICGIFADWSPPDHVTLVWSGIGQSLWNFHRFHKVPQGV